MTLAVLLVVEVAEVVFATEEKSGLNVADALAVEEPKSPNEFLRIRDLF